MHLKTDIVHNVGINCNLRYKQASLISSFFHVFAIASFVTCLSFLYLKPLNLGGINSLIMIYPAISEEYVYHHLHYPENLHLNCMACKWPVELAFPDRGQTRVGLR